VIAVTEGNLTRRSLRRILLAAAVTGLNDFVSSSSVLNMVVSSGEIGDAFEEVSDNGYGSDLRGLTCFFGERLGRFFVG
jgi:hypothetical protein